MSSKLSELEVLHRAEQTLADPDQPFAYKDWNLCTCGHVYHAAAGHTSVHSIEGLRWAPPMYEKALLAAVKALGLEDELEDASPASVISDYTALVAHRDRKGAHGIKRSHALKVIRRAIRNIEEADQEVIRVRVIDAHNYEQGA